MPMIYADDLKNYICNRDFGPNLINLLILNFVMLDFVALRGEECLIRTSN